MTGNAITRNTAMIKRRAKPTGGGMASVTLRGSRDMRGSFAARDRAIVTGRTSTNHLGMVDDESTNSHAP